MVDSSTRRRGYAPRALLSTASEHGDPVVPYRRGIDADLVYDRRLLLDGAKRDVVLDVAEVRQYGIHSFGDPEYVSISGMRPIEWFDGDVGSWVEQQSSAPAMRLPRQLLPTSQGLSRSPRPTQASWLSTRSRAPATPCTG